MPDHFAEHCTDHARNPSYQHDDVKIDQIRDALLFLLPFRAYFPLKGKENNLSERVRSMNPQVHVEEHLEMETEVQATVTETDKLAQCGLSAEEIVALLWLRQWSQMRSLMYEERQVIARRLSHTGLWAEPQVRDRPEEQDRFQAQATPTIDTQ